MLRRDNVSANMDVYATAPTKGIFLITLCRSAYGQTDGYINGGYLFHSQQSGCDTYHGFANKGDVLRLHMYSGNVYLLEVYFIPFK